MTFKPTSSLKTQFQTVRSIAHPSLRWMMSQSWQFCSLLLLLLRRLAPWRLDSPSSAAARRHLSHRRSPGKVWFLVLFLMSWLSVSLIAPLFNSPAAIAAGRDIRGVWLTTNDTATLRDQTKLQEAIAQLRQVNFNTVYPVVWNSGYALYPSAVAQRANIQPFVFRGLQGQDMIGDVISQAHRQGLLAIPWFEFGFMAPPTSELALNHPDWLTQQRDGSQTSISAAGEVVWLNPFHPEVQKFIIDLVVEVETQYNADGIQFDDHMSLPDEFGYDPYTVALYKKETKKDPPANSQDPAWIKWRADKITAFMAQLSKAVKAQNSRAIVSVSPNYYDFAYRFHLQDWLGWIKQNIVDELVVQVYRSDIDSFIEQIDRPEIKEAQQKIATGIGVLTGLRNNPVDMRRITTQVRALQSRGLGVAFFYYESLWNDAPESAAERKAGFQALLQGMVGRSTN